MMNVDGEKVIEKGGVKWKMLKGGSLTKIACLRCPVRVVSPEGGGGPRAEASADSCTLLLLYLRLCI